MTKNLGQILALAGLVLVLVNNLGRQRGRKRSQSDASLSLWQRWSPLFAYALILAGLAWMMASKW